MGHQLTMNPVTGQLDQVRKMATNAETITGTETDKAVSPAGLTAKLAAPGPIGETTPGPGNFTDVNSSSLTASKLIASDANKKLVSIETTVFLTGGDQEIDGDKLDIDFTPVNYIPDTTPAEANHADNLAAHLAGIDNALGKWYGVAWNESTDAYSRRGALAGIAGGAKPTYAGAAAEAQMIPVQAAMRRCVISDAGAVQYYLDPDDSTKKADGSAAVLDGTDGQVMVEIPAFYTRYSYASNTHNWDISLQPLSGFTLHPAFVKDGARVDYRYVGAYEGSMYDDSESAMVASGDIASGLYAAGDLLCSISGQYPKTNETRAEFRAMASSRGAGWRQLDFFLLSAVQLLYLVEYADFNSQAMIGAGRTNLSGGGWTAGSYIGITGLSNGDGNGTGAVQNGTSAGYATDYMTYRGIENLYGNVWKWVDGINVNSNIPYVCNNEALPYADDTATGYTRLVDAAGADVTLINADGYQKTLEQLPIGFLPASVGGGSGTYTCDYYYQASGWRVVQFGGYAYYGAAAGAFCVYAAYASSHIAVYIGGRLCF